MGQKINYRSRPQVRAPSKKTYFPTALTQTKEYFSKCCHFEKTLYIITKINIDQYGESYCDNTFNISTRPKLKYSLDILLKEVVPHWSACVLFDAFT